MRWLASASLTAPLLLLAASAPAQLTGDTLESAVQRAEAERAAAEAEAAKLQRAADTARSEAARLRAEQAAAAQAIAAAEARITASDARLRLAAGYLAARRQRLAREQQPVASLLTGLAIMAQRPPLLAVADRGSTDELVRVRVLLDSTLPVIRRRTAALNAELSEGQRLAASASSARAELLRSREDLLARRQRFAALEQRTIAMAARTSGEALSVGDVALAAGEDVERLRSGAAGSRAAAALASALAGSEPAPPRPARGEAGPAANALAYELPAAAAVIDGFGSVNASGIRSRGITLATARGALVSAPAAGTVRFSGPFRDYDGILIIDHGGGWMSLLLNVASQLKPGAKVRLGEPIGRALGPLGVELSQNGRRTSPALIAGSSATLSNKAKRG